MPSSSPGDRERNCSTHPTSAPPERQGDQTCHGPNILLTWNMVAMCTPIYMHILYIYIYIYEYIHIDRKHVCMYVRTYLCIPLSPSLSFSPNLSQPGWVFDLFCMQLPIDACVKINVWKMKAWCKWLQTHACYIYICICKYECVYKYIYRYEC
jgi:hypothetical protein